MGLDLSELEDMHSDDPVRRKEWLRTLPITISRGEYDDLLAAKKRLSVVLSKLETLLEAKGSTLVGP